MRDVTALVLLATVYLASLTNSAQAYLDPGSASVILQGIIGGIAAAAATLAVYWDRAKLMFARLLGRSKTDSKSSSR